MTWATARTAQPSAATVTISRPRLDVRSSQQGLISTSRLRERVRIRADDAHGCGEHGQGAGAARFPGSITPQLEPNPQRREEGDEDEQERAATPTASPRA